MALQRTRANFNPSAQATIDHDKAYPDFVGRMLARNREFQ